MILAIGKGNVVSTNKTEKLTGSKPLIVEEWNLETKRLPDSLKVALIWSVPERARLCCV